MEYRADWYPDPTRRFEFRYHNGVDWTGDVAVDGNRFVDPLPRPSVAPTASSLPERTGKATAAMVLGIGAVAVGWVPFVFVFAVVASVLALVFGIPALRRANRQQPVNRRAKGFALTGVILAPIGLALCGIGLWLSVLIYREVELFTQVGEHTVRETTCTLGDGRATYSGTITNDSASTRSYHLEVSFLRPGTDNVLYTDGVDVDDVAPGDTAPWSTSVVVEENELDCEVADVTGPLPFGQS